ncbi:MAG: class I SAM-dependent methyltransferase [Lachnospiraceae bacterium]|nr:class I SAM-dependent methyltransferase [Lachnospiraceae bacterium]
MQKYHIEKNTVQETLIIPLYGRKVCSDRFPELFKDPEAERICNMLDYDFEEKGRRMESGVGLFGALEVAQRQYDIACEVRDYLKKHPRAAVVNLGCGLDDTFHKCDNGTCRGYNIDMPDVIAVRNELLPAGDREENLGSDLNDESWMNEIAAGNGAIFYATGVFYYFKTEDVRMLLSKLAKRFPGAVIVFDACNRRGAKMMTKTWLKEAGISDVKAFFSLESAHELEGWSNNFAKVSSKSYMRGYRDIYDNVGMLHKLMIKFCDKLVKMIIVKIEFKDR